MTGDALWDAAAVGAVDVLRARVATALAADPYDGDAIAADALLAAANREIDRAVYRAAGAAGACAGPEGQLALGAAWQYADDVAAAVARLDKGVRLLLEAGRLDRAVALLEQFAALLPSRSPLLHALGWAREEAGDPSGAAEAYRQAMEATPVLAAPALALAQLVEERDPREAVAALAHALAADPHQPQIWLRLGRLLHRIGDHHGARDAFEHSLRQEPGGAVVEFELGELLLRMGRRREAIDRFRAAVALDAALAEAHFELGTLLEDEHPLEAAEAYRRAVAARPGYADAALRLGAILERQGLLDDALIALRLGAAECPDRAAKFQRRILSALFKKQDWTAAAAAALEGLRRAPDDSGFAYDRAEALVMSAHFAEAEECLLDYARHRIESGRSQPPALLEQVYLWSNQMADAAAWRAAHPAAPEPTRDWSQALAAGRLVERRLNATAPQHFPGLSARHPLALTVAAATPALTLEACVRFHFHQGCDVALILDDGADPARRAIAERLAAALPVAVIDIPAQRLSPADQATLLVCVARDALGADWALLGAPGPAGDAYWLAPDHNLKAAIAHAANGPFAQADLLLARTTLILPRQDHGRVSEQAFWRQIDAVDRPWPRLDDQRGADGCPLEDQTVRPHALCVRTAPFRAAPAGAAPLSTAPVTGWFVDVEALRFSPEALAAEGPAPERCVEAPLNQWLKLQGRIRDRTELRAFLQDGMPIARRLRPLAADVAAAAQQRGDGLLNLLPSA